ncbi:MAG: glycosyltransferase [Candidatus Pacearchaeota archaeon]|jgi:glycosyltransferase involved in cell wall biosynthesis|nr:glycosyltransferase [Candidatus Pacearchaeota archaeon]
MGVKNVLLVAPPLIPTSKDSIAGSEQMIYVLGRALIEQGHNVTTIAREDSRVYGKLVSGGFKDFQFHKDSEIDQFYQVMAHTASAVRKFIRCNSNLDVIVDRTCQGLSLQVSHEENGPPVLCCLNMPSEYFLNIHFFNHLREKFKERKDKFIAVSNHIAKEYQNALQLGDLKSRMNIIYNGIVTDNFSFSEVHKGYLLYLGRITKDKAPHLAIKLAQNTDHKIIVAGGNIEGNNTMYQDEGYIEKEIRPLMNNNVKWHGPANLEQKVALLKNAKALIFSRESYEPFSSVPIEAMMCGTPVIAFDKGGTKEAIINNKTGFLVNTYEEMKKAVSKIDTIDRATCTLHVKNNFDYQKMIKKYMELID